MGRRCLDDPLFSQWLANREFFNLAAQEAEQTDNESCEQFVLKPNPRPPFSNTCVVIETL